MSGVIISLVGNSSSLLPAQMASACRANWEDFTAKKESY